MRLGSMKVIPLEFLTEVAERPSTHLYAAKRYNPPKSHFVSYATLILSLRQATFHTSIEPFVE
ncbi:hypothetical protein DNHGIG_12210 [Collibacillus ludicampi]|uniref:Uncharacterized protein n=1 Tax=Collibacillus ludicampi TaxID=2771369 RepID=A0AAV4LE06_9BACL|nr:hypothetical protein DNHGIG_12210 [Collibacillus ludicampi]